MQREKTLWMQLIPAGADRRDSAFPSPGSPYRRFLFKRARRQDERLALEEERAELENSSPGIIIARRAF